MHVLKQKAKLQQRLAAQLDGGIQPTELDGHRASQVLDRLAEQYGEGPRGTKQNSSEPSRTIDMELRACVLLCRDDASGPGLRSGM